MASEKRVGVPILVIVLLISFSMSPKFATLLAGLKEFSCQNYATNNCGNGDCYLSVIGMEVSSYSKGVRRQFVDLHVIQMFRLFHMLTIKQNLLHRSDPILGCPLNLAKFQKGH